MSTKLDTKQPDTDNETLAKVLGDFKAAWEYTQGSWHKRWEDNYKLYNNQRVSVGYVGIANNFVPMVSSTVDTLTSGLYGSKPQFDYTPPADRENQSTDILNGLLDYFWDKDQWSVKIPETGKFKFMLGTAIDYFAWENDHPVMIHVPIRDFFIDPLATTLEDARYMGRRYITTLEQLKEFEVVDPATGKMVKKYKNLDRVMDYKNPDYTDKEQKDMWYGTTISKPEDTDLVECIELWTEDKVITAANRCTVIEDTENYYKAQGKQNGNKYAKGIMPFADDRDKVDPSLFYAKSVVDDIAQQQEQLNDLTNQLSDALTYTINQQYTIDPDVSHLQGQVKNLPGATYVAPKDAINPIMRGTIPPDAFAQIQNIKNEIRETTGANEIVKGAPADGGKATATEINAQIAGAGQRIGLKVTQLENGYYHRVARIVFAMVCLYVTKPMMVRILGKDGARWKQFDPKEYRDGDYEPRIQLDITVQNRKLDEANIAKEMLGAFLGDQDVNQVWLKKKVLAAGFELEPDELEAAFTPNPLPEEPLMDDIMPADPMAAVMDTGFPPPIPPDAGAGMGMPLDMQGPPIVVDPETGLLIDTTIGQPLEDMPL